MPPPSPVSSRRAAGDLPGDVSWNRIDEADPTSGSLCSWARLRTDSTRTRQLFGRTVDSSNGRVGNLWVHEQTGLDFYRRDLPSTYTDRVLSRKSALERERSWGLRYSCLWSSLVSPISPVFNHPFSKALLVNFGPNFLFFGTRERLSGVGRLTASPPCLGYVECSTSATSRTKASLCSKSQMCWFAMNSDADYFSHIRDVQPTTHPSSSTPSDSTSIDKIQSRA